LSSYLLCDSHVYVLIKTHKGSENQLSMVEQLRLDIDDI